MSRLADLGHRLYRGDASYDFIGRRRWWYIGSGVVMLVAILSLAVRGLHFSIDFTGGDVFQVPAHGQSVSYASSVVSGAGYTPEVVQKVGEGQIRIETKSLSTTDTNKLQDTLAKKFGVSTNQVTVDTVGGNWGSQITHKALLGLGIFLVLFVLLASMAFEPKMAASAIVALCHDLLITAGIYSLVGFEVAPATVIALLTILGYSLYDTVVVFDKVRENTAGLAGGSRMTYSQAVNLAVNQTLVRSINTSVIALLPVASLLFIGAGLLGAGTLKDLALALLIGLLSGAYSSIFIASPLLTDLKEREPQYRQLARRVQGRQAAAARERTTQVSSAGGGTTGVATPATTTAVLDPAGSGATPGTDGPESGDRGRPSAPRQPRPARKQPARGGRTGRPSSKRRR